jgi:2-polyprenyl-3-methyl-5-hydroxy-6-metoxy-1,4-benzoquinol methylase
MKPHERENWRYSVGSDNPIGLAERAMFSLLPKLNKGKLLDVGCGVGTISLELLNLGFKVYGIDFSSVAVEKAVEKGISAILCDVDKEGIPFKDGCFDVVWAGDIVEHVFDPIFLLEEIARVLHPTGKVLISTPNDMHVYRRISLFVSGKSPQSDVYRQYKQCKHHTVMSVELLEYMLATAGLSTYSIGAIIKLPKQDRKYSDTRLLTVLFGRTLVVEARKIRQRTACLGDW